MREIPRMDSSAPPVGNRPGGHHAAVRTGIVVIDDDPDCRLLVRDAIEEAVGGQVDIHECRNGREGLEYLCAQPDLNPEALPALVFLDLEMPQMNGIDVLRSVRAIPELSALPIVVLTGVDDDRAEQQVLLLGANSYACKGKDAHTLLTRVSQAATYWTRVHRPFKYAPDTTRPEDRSPPSETRAA